MPSPEPAAPINPVPPGIRVARQIKSATAELRAKVGRLRTEEVVGSCSTYELSRAASDDDSQRLHSPARQIEFLLGILLETPEPGDPEPMTEDCWPAIVVALNGVFNVYSELFWTSPLDTGVRSSAWNRIREVASPAFFHQHFGALLASIEQIERRIERYVIPFDKAVSDALDLSATEMLAVARWIAQDVQRGADRLYAAHTTMRSVHADIMRDVQSQFAIARMARTPAVISAATEFQSAMTSMFKVEYSALLAEFGEVGGRFWERFSIARGVGPELVYPTERSVAHSQPLIRLTERTAMVASVNAVYHAILTVSEGALRTGSISQSFFARRDAALEAESIAHFRRLVGPTAVVYEGVFEFPDDQFEHDAVVVVDDVVFILEAKASPPREPFRDPEKAFLRLRDAFHSDGGVQKAFEQAARIKRRLDRGERVELFARGGTLVTTLNPSALRGVYCVGVTRDDFGALATDLTLLLDKQGDEPYPWIVNVLDMEALADAWEYLGWGLPALRAYLDQRHSLHGRVYSTDELDFAGCYIRHGSFHSVLVPGMDVMQLDPRYSDFFDELYAHQHHGSPPPRANIGDAVATDLRASLDTGQPVHVPFKRGTQQVGRNDPCTCGSGRKFKKCHGGPSRP